MTKFLVAYACCEYHGETTICYVEAEDLEIADKMAKEAKISPFSVYATPMNEFWADNEFLESLDQKIEERRARDNWPTSYSESNGEKD